MAVFIVLHLLFRCSWFLLVLSMRHFIELLFVGIFVCFPSGVWLSMFVALEFFCFLSCLFLVCVTA